MQTRTRGITNVILSFQVARLRVRHLSRIPVGKTPGRKSLRSLRVASSEVQISDEWSTDGSEIDFDDSIDRRTDWKCFAITPS